MQTSIDKYFTEGCLRCKYGATPQCKVNTWQKELKLLQQIVVQTGLKEEIKWGIPVYTHKGKNVVFVNALKESANISFYKGVLLTDPNKILTQQGNLQSDRIVKFTDTKSIKQVEKILQAYIKEAIALEEAGKKVSFNKNPEPVPDELTNLFEKDAAFKKAFYELTPRRQRGYIIHFSQPKQTATRLARIEKYKEQIVNGIGFHDNYKK